MADNYRHRDGHDSATIGADDIGGVHYPRVKVVHGADGSQVDTSDANPLPVVTPGGEAAAGDSMANPTEHGAVLAHGLVWDTAEQVWQRERATHATYLSTSEILAAADRSATVSAVLDMRGRRSVALWVTITSRPTTGGSVSFEVWNLAQAGSHRFTTGVVVALAPGASPASSVILVSPDALDGTPAWNTYQRALTPFIELRFIHSDSQVWNYDVRGALF